MNNARYASPWIQNVLHYRMNGRRYLRHVVQVGYLLDDPYLCVQLCYRQWSTAVRACHVGTYAEMARALFTRARFGRAVFASTLLSVNRPSAEDDESQFTARMAIDNHELNELSNKMEHDFRLLPQMDTTDNGKGDKNDTSMQPVDYALAQCSDDNEWETLIDQTTYKLYRRPLKDSNYLYEYKCLARYTDITATAFFQAQIDNDYRKQWDNLVISLDVLEIDRKTGSELVRWVTHFPYPMSSREYIYARRSCIDPCRHRMIISQRTIDATSHPLATPSQQYVHVNTYTSTMLIRPHGSFDALGLDFVLLYVDDPKARFPGPAYKWMVKYGVPGYLEKVHQAAKQLLPVE